MAGVLGAASVEDAASIGLDAAFPALFLALLAPRLADRGVLAASVLAALVAMQTFAAGGRLIVDARAAGLAAAAVAVALRAPTILVLGVAAVVTALTRAIGTPVLV